jgi:hypothetical protein
MLLIHHSKLTPMAMGHRPNALNKALRASEPEPEPERLSLSLSPTVGSIQIIWPRSANA